MPLGLVGLLFGACMAGGAALSGINTSSPGKSSKSRSGARTGATGAGRYNGRANGGEAR